jgi:C-terminal processing protease CtpA/Prc
MSKDVSSVAHSRDHQQQNNKNRHLFRGAERFDSADRTRKGKMTGDGSMLISKDSEHLEPISVKLNESWKVSGVIVVSIEKKSSTLEKPGIRIGVKETSTGHVLYISDINPSSMFANTPLLVGDIIISINGINLHDNADVVDAYSALGIPGKQITLVAKKGEASLNDFLLNGRSQPLLPKDKRQGSVNTSLTSLTSGTMGTSVSGESSRDMIRDCTKSYDSPLAGSRNSSHSNRTNSRTDDFEFDEEIEAIDEEIEASKTNSEANDTNSRGPISNSGKMLRMLEEVEENQESASPATSLRLQEERKDSKSKGKKKRQKVLITVTKRNKGQKIGIEFTLLNNKLVVSEVSPTGLLRNAPLVFGDTILSINGVSFQIDPVAKDAFSLIKNAREKVTLEILKTEYGHDKRDVGVSNKSCMSPLFWSRRSTKL